MLGKASEVSSFLFFSTATCIWGRGSALQASLLLLEINFKKSRLFLLNLSLLLFQVFSLTITMVTLRESEPKCNKLQLKKERKHLMSPLILNACFMAISVPKGKPKRKRKPAAGINRHRWLAEELDEVNNLFPTS